MIVSDFVIEITPRQPIRKKEKGSDLTRVEQICLIRDLAMQNYLKKLKDYKVTIESITFDGFKNEIRNVIFTLFASKNEHELWILLVLRDIETFWSIFISRMYYERRRNKNMQSWLLCS